MPTEPFKCLQIFHILVCLRFSLLPYCSFLPNSHLHTWFCLHLTFCTILYILYIYIVHTSFFFYFISFHFCPTTICIASTLSLLFFVISLFTTSLFPHFVILYSSCSQKDAGNKDFAHQICLKKCMYKNLQRFVFERDLVQCGVYVKIALWKWLHFVQSSFQMVVKE